MRSFSKFIFAALLTAIAAPALAQGTGTSSIAVQQPWARATPTGATTGAVYMTADRTEETACTGRNISADADFPKSREYFRHSSSTRQRRITKAA